MAGKRPSDAMAVVTSSANLHLGLFGDLQREMRMPIRRIRELFRFALPNATVDTMAATGHMGPITHASAVACRVARFVTNHASVLTGSPPDEGFRRPSRHVADFSAQDAVRFASGR